MKTFFKTLMLKNNNKGKRKTVARSLEGSHQTQDQIFLNALDNINTFSSVNCWIAEQGAERDWDKERVCQNVEQWIYYFDMFSIEGII